MIEIPRMEEERRLAVLLGRGCGPGWPKRRFDRLVLLRRASRCVGAGEAIAERAISERLRAWLEDEAKRLELDAAEIRRALVDEGFVERDRAGSAYRRSDRHRARMRFEADAAAGEDAP
jgi:hypothetical protein